MLKVQMKQNKKQRKLNKKCTNTENWSQLKLFHSLKHYFKTKIVIKRNSTFKQYQHTNNGISRTRIKNVSLKHVPNAKHNTSLKHIQQFTLTLKIFKDQSLLHQR